MLQVSLIIPVYNDWTGLNKCLKAIEKQSFNKNNFEVIVVDNGSSYSATLPKYTFRLKLIKECKPGSYAARNAGLAISEGSIIGFIDADCIPERNWLQSAVNGFKSGEDRVCGPVEVFRQSNDSIVELHESIFGFPVQSYCDQGFAPTANLFVRRDIFDSVGLFNANLLSGGDFEWGKRATKQGFKLCFKSDVRVLHPARQSLNDLLKKKRRVAAGHFMIDRRKSLTLRFAHLVYAFIPKYFTFKRLLNSSNLKWYVEVRLFALFYFLPIYTCTYMLYFMFFKPSAPRS